MRGFWSVAAPAATCSGASPSRPFQNRLTSLERSHCYNEHSRSKGAEHDGRVVTLGQLVLFSTDTGDAWLLDVTDQLAARLARDGDPEPIHLEEGDTSFAIGWKGRYHIEGLAFIYTDRDTGRVTTILGYPTQTIARAG